MARSNNVLDLRLSFLSDERRALLAFVARVGQRTPDPHKETFLALATAICAANSSDDRKVRLRLSLEQARWLAEFCASYPIDHQPEEHVRRSIRYLSGALLHNLSIAGVRVSYPGAKRAGLTVAR